MKTWNPGYHDKYNNFIPYEKKWYCNNNKQIHQTEKEADKCPHCKDDQNKEHFNQ